jgi:hypothetical protein
MSGTTIRSVSFSDLHIKLLDRLAKDHHMTFSAVNRVIINFAQDYDPELGLIFYADDRKAAEAELTAAQAKFTESDGAVRACEAKLKAENREPPKAVFNDNLLTEVKRDTAPKAPSIDNRPGQTEEQRWRVRVGHVLNPPPNMSKEDIGNVERSVVENAKKHSDWLDRLPNEQQVALRGKMGRVLDPTTNLPKNDDKLWKRKSSETVSEEPINSVNKTTAPKATSINYQPAQDDEAQEYAHFKQLMNRVTAGEASDEDLAEIREILAKPKHRDWRRKVADEHQRASKIVLGSVSR